MRKKQARPARRVVGGVLPERGDPVGGSGNLISPVRDSPSSSPPVHSIPSTEILDDSTGSHFCASAFRSETPLKAPASEPDDFWGCCRTTECTSFSTPHLAHYGSFSRHKARIPASCHTSIISDINDHQKSFFPVFTASNNSMESICDISATKLPRVDEPAASTDSESPLKRLERCVRASSKGGGSIFELYRNSGPSAARYDLIRSCRNTDSIKLHSEHDSTKTSATDALGELSQLVHRIGTVQLPIPTAPNKCAPNSITSNIFTCLKCGQRFDTLDELVLHISTTKHFTRGSTKNFDAVAPWEKNRAGANFEKQAVSSNFLARLFYAHKFLKVPQNLSQGSMNSNF